MAAVVDFLFLPDDREPLHLVFGDEPGGGAAPAYTLAGGGRISGLRSGGTMGYDANVERPALAWRRSTAQPALPTSSSVRSAAQAASPLSVAHRTSAQPAQPIARSVRARAQAATPLSRTVRPVAQVAAPAASTVRSAFQRTIHIGSAARSVFQPGQPVQAGARARFQEVIRLALNSRSRFEPGTAAATVAHSGMSIGIHLVPGWRVGFQTARYPSPGATPKPPIDNRGDWCYVPALPVDLLFRPDGRTPLDLLFECGVPEPEKPGPLAPLYILPARYYMTFNSLLLRRVAGDIALNASSVDLSIDHKSWTWSWSAGLEKSALALLAPDDGDLVEMELSVNGVPYRLHAEDVERTRRFPKTSVACVGGGLALELDEPVALQQYFSAASARTAQQLANEALTVNGVGIGWDIEWGLTDWLVPGGVWSHQGTHISAVRAIAAAAGGYVQPHPTARILRVLPGYPAAPWDWAGLTPDIELPADPVTLEGIRWQSRPAYDRVFVSGDGRSTIWQVTRAGTAGAVDAPMVVDQLATHVDAARQRGMAVLGDTGRQALVTLSLPVLPETGLIVPGKLVRYVDGPTTRIGLVRSCAVEWRRPRLRQRISLETHI